MNKWIPLDALMNMKDESMNTIGWINEYEEKLKRWMDESNIFSSDELKYERMN